MQTLGYRLAVTIDELSGRLVRGAVAGAIGTAAMTASSTLEARIRDRSASSAPADALTAVLEVEPVDNDAEQRLSSIAHWGYGTAWGTVRGLLDGNRRGFAGPTAAHLAAVLAGEQVVLPATGAAPPATEWGAREVAVDVLHHAVYAIATGLAYRALRPR